ncbi:MAG: hypothetical protein PVF34_07600 [Gammaproteobacteria bacterium]|jgi:hypothetical protein
MVGKKNVVFGFLYLVLSAGLGPYMIIQYMPGVEDAGADKQEKLGQLQNLQMNNFDNMETLEPMTADQIAKSNTSGILALNKLHNAEQPIDLIKNPHAHANLEALLNIAAGIALSFIAVSVIFKQIISWVFIAGAVLHSGMLYLAVVFQMGWANTILNSGVGPALVLLGLLLAGIAAAMGMRPEIAKD